MIIRWFQQKHLQITSVLSESFRKTAFILKNNYDNNGNTADVVYFFSSVIYPFRINKVEWNLIRCMSALARLPMLNWPLVRDEALTSDLPPPAPRGSSGSADGSGVFGRAKR